MVKLNRPNRATSWRLSALLTVMAFGGACVQLLGLEPGELKGSATSSGAGGAGQGGTGGAGQGGTSGLCGDGAGGAGQGGTPLVPSFAAAVNYPVGAKPYSVTAGDWNGDGKADLAVANSGSVSVSGNVSILLGNGNGTFPVMIDYVVGMAPVAVTAGDWNGDGKPDLAVANNNSQNVSILLGIGDGDGTFKTTDPVTVGVNPIALTAGDWNGDGKPDLAVANDGSNSVSIRLGNGGGTFKTTVDYLVGTNPFSVKARDWNGDKKLDLAVANSGSMNVGNKVSILVGKGDGTFQSQVDYGVGWGPRSVTAGHWNGDDKLDLAVANSGSMNVSILLNTSQQ